MRGIYRVLHLYEQSVVTKHRSYYQEYARFDRARLGRVESDSNDEIYYQ